MNLMFLLATLTVLSSVSCIEWKELKNTTLLEVLQKILQDPEYLALSNEQKLAVLEIIYSYLIQIDEDRKAYTLKKQQN